jgi:hypothetical protein
MKKLPLVPHIVGLSLALFFAGNSLLGQSPSPTQTPSPACPLGFGWAEGLAQYTTYPAPLFPTQDTANLSAPDCAFHQWSWEAFVWATAIGPDGRARFATLHNGDELGKKAGATAKGPKPLGLKPRDLKPPGPRGSGDDPAQAGGGILVDQNGQILWYSTHMNDSYYQFLQQYSGAGYAQAPLSLNFPVGAAVFKASWQVVPAGTTLTGFYTEKTTVPLLINKPGGGITVDPSGKTRSVTVALVGLHVVGVTANHPEFLWGTFEQVQNAPDLADPNGYNSPTPVSNKSFTFYAANTPANACNPAPKSTTLKITDPVKQTVAPIINVFRQYATGGAEPARTQDIVAVNGAAQNEMAQMGTLVPPQPKETVWANYKLIGTLWIEACTLQPGVSQLEKQGIASIDLANATLETFFQGPQNNFNGNPMANCFMCHNTGGSGPNSKKVYPGKNINLSHALLDSIPATTPTPTPAAKKK